MKITSGTVDKIGRVVVDSLLLALFFTMLVIPASSFSVLKYDTSINASGVLSSQDVRENPVDPTKTYREFDMPPADTAVQDYPGTPDTFDATETQDTSYTSESQKTEDTPENPEAQDTTNTGNTTDTEEVFE